MENPEISIVVPVYNEQEVCLHTYQRLTNVMEQAGTSYEILFVDDGSKDKTPETIKGICKQDKRIMFLRLSRNFGQIAAISCGLDFAKGKAIIVIDADLQDPPELIIEMIKKWRDGYEIVHAKRLKREKETIFFKVAAFLFYRFLRKMTDVNIPKDTGEFKLFDRKVCDILKKLPEKNRYIPGLVSWTGFKQTEVEYIRQGRFAGKTKVSLGKLMKLALSGITSFSNKPLKIATFFGFLISISGFVYLFIILYQKIFMGIGLYGWPSTLSVILFSQGLLLIILGIIGEYIGILVDEVKGRPIYILDEVVGEAKTSSPCIDKHDDVL
jgi:dolichol-phosphate mannosyltransferase